MQIEKWGQGFRLARKPGNALLGKQQLIVHDRAPIGMPDAVNGDHAACRNLQALGFLGRCGPRLHAQKLAGRFHQTAIGAVKPEILEEEAQRVMRCAARHHGSLLPPAGQQPFRDEIRHGPPHRADGDAKALARFETIRAHGALRMGLIEHLDEIAQRQHTPKIAFVSKPAPYVSSSGKPIAAEEIDLLVRALSMGKLHHAMMGTAAVAIATAAAIPGTLVNLAAGGGERNAVCFGHPSGTLRVGAQARQQGDDWVVDKALMSRSARVLMEGWVRVPGDVL